MAIEEEPPVGIPEWVVTFGDMMSLLLTFFIMLLSMSEMKEEDEKFQVIVESIRQQFGHDQSMASLAPGNFRPRNSQVRELASQGRAMRANTKNGGAKTRAPVGDEPTPLVIQRGDKTPQGIYLIFDADSTALTEKHKTDLQYSADMFGGKPHKIEVRGHASKKTAPGVSPYDLAYERAKTVAEYLVDELGIEQDRIVISSAGPNEPVHTGSDVLEERKNSRVEVYMLDKTVADLSGAKDESPDQPTPSVPLNQNYNH